MIKLKVRLGLKPSLALKPSYYQKTFNKCWVCGNPLYGVDRYLIILYLRSEAFKGVSYRRFAVCINCLSKALDYLRDEPIRKRFRFRYRKMRKLEDFRKPIEAGFNE